MSPRPAAYFAAVSALLLQGCLYTSHHFNSGRVLAPGKTAVTFGIGKLKLYDETCRGGKSPDMDSSGAAICREYDAFGDTSSYRPSVHVIALPKVSLGYRLGVRREWGPFTGVELGWHMEVPTNPGSAEFDLKFGLPAPRKHFHSLSGGWIVGSWADNSFFGEYAASRAFGGGDSSHALYASYRLTYLATQPDETVQGDSIVTRFSHHRRYTHQATAGVYLRLPAIPLVPDFVTPQFTVTMPVVPSFEGARPDVPYVIDINMGVGWRF